MPGVSLSSLRAVHRDHDMSSRRLGIMLCRYALLHHVENLLCRGIANSAGAGGKRKRSASRQTDRPTAGP